MFRNFHQNLQMKVMMFVVLMAVAFTIHAQEIGVQLYTFRDQFKKDVKGTVELIHSMGIKEIEGGDGYGMDKIEFKKLLDANQLKTVSVGADYDQLAKDPQAIIDNAKFMVRHTWFVSGTHSKIFTIEDAKESGRSI